MEIGDGKREGREREILVNHADKMAGGDWEGARGRWGEGFQVNHLKK